MLVAVKLLSVCRSSSEIEWFLIVVICHSRISELAASPRCTCRQFIKYAYSNSTHDSDANVAVHHDVFRPFRPNSPSPHWAIPIIGRECSNFLVLLGLKGHAEMFLESLGAAMVLFTTPSCPAPLITPALNVA